VQVDEHEPESSLILVLDDIEETRDVTEKLLHASGYSVQCARNEAEAVLRAGWRVPQLILLSLDGDMHQAIAIAGRVKMGARLADKTVAVVIDNLVIPEGAEIAMGDNVYVTRPDNFDQLRRFLAEVLAVKPTAL